MVHWLSRYSAGLDVALWAPLAALVVVVALTVAHLVDSAARRWAWKALAAIAAVMFVVQAYLALEWAPPERYMGDTGRILYIHVPLIVLGMAALAISFGASIIYLFRKSWFCDALAEATVVVGLVYGGLGVLLGAIWAKPTWGTWWTWDPRLTTSAIMLVIYVGYLAFRRFVDDPERRAMWSAALNVFAAVDIPIVYQSVRWWRSMHQVQSNPSTVDPQMVMVLRWSYTMCLALMVVLIYQQYLLVAERQKREVATPEYAV